MMSSPSRRSGALLLAAALAAGLLAGATSALAASSPEAAVNELLDRAAAGGLDDLDDLVCPEQQAAVRGQLDLAAILADPSDDADTGALEGMTFQLTDRTVALVSEDGDTAVVRLTGRLSFEIDTARAREYVRGLLEGTGGEFSDADLDRMVALMTSSLAAGQEVDEELIVIRDGGEWLICDELAGETESQPGPAFEASVSEDGICGLLSPAELSELGPLTYDSSFGSGDFCTYSSTSFEDFQALTVSIDRSNSIEDFRAFFGGGEEMLVADLVAYAQGETLYVAVEDGVLQVNAYLGEGPQAEGLDAIANAAGVAELIIPRLPDLPVRGGAEDSGESDPIGEPEPAGVALCEVLPLDELNAMGPPTYDEAMGEAGSCFFTAASDEQGFRSLTMYTETLELDLLMGIFPDGTELEIAGRPAYSDGTSLWVGLGERLLTIVPYHFGTPPGEEVDSVGYAVRVAEIVVPRLLEAGQAE